MTTMMASTMDTPGLDAPVVTATAKPSVLAFVPAGGGVPLELSVSDMTVALFYSGARLSWEVTADEVAGLVMRGVTRLGLDEVRHLHTVDRATGSAWLRGEISDQQYTSCRRRVWPRSEGGERQYDFAKLLAIELTRVAEGRPFLEHLKRQ
jgi:hypothetical protein